MAPPTIAVTMGDPGGVGPEILLKALARPAVRRLARWVVFGDGDWLRRTNRPLRLPSQPCWDALLDARNVSLRWASRHRPCAASGRAAHRYITEAVRYIQNGRADALVTAPISKWSFVAAGLAAAGHTELLARLTRSPHVAMLLVSRRLKVLLATRHLPLLRVAASLRPEALVEDVRLLHTTLRRGFGIRQPRIAVAGLNPHAGEQGTLGGEEERVILPAIRLARRRLGPGISGPWAADAVFYDAYRGRYDAVVCMYHDQGSVPLKMIARDAGVNVTLGLPFVRTSPDHGTGFDIAGTGQANPGSMIAAMQLAVALVKKTGRAHPH